MVISGMLSLASRRAPKYLRFHHNYTYTFTMDLVRPFQHLNSYAYHGCSSLEIPMDLVVQEHSLLNLPSTRGFSRIRNHTRHLTVRRVFYRGFGGAMGPRFGRPPARAYDEYLKAYSVAMLPGRERENLSYGGKSALLSITHVSPILITIAYHSNNASICFGKSNKSRS